MLEELLGSESGIVLWAGDRLEPHDFDPLSPLANGNMDQVCSSSLFLVPSLIFAPLWVGVRVLGQLGLFPLGSLGKPQGPLV